MAVTPIEDDIARARVDLLFSRLRFILFYCAVIYPFFFLLDWHERPWDRTAALIIRVATALIMLALVRLAQTVWGRSNALLLASVGFLIAHAGFAVIVWHAKGFGSSNGDAFELFFGPYCVLVPAPTAYAAVVGAAMICIQLAAYALAGAPVHYDDVVWNAIPFFVIFLTGRHLANLIEVAWRRGFLDLAKLRATQDELVHSAKTVAFERLAASVAHELKNPLFAIGSIVSILERDLPPLLGGHGQSREGAHKISELFDTIESLRCAADTAASVSDSLGRLSRPQSREPVLANLNTLLDSALSIVEMKARLKQTVLHKNYGELISIRCDSQSLIQVFVNLLDNALDAISPNGNVWISTRPLGTERISVVIRDDGTGVAPENLPRLFEPFFSTKRPGTGTGLGLSLSRSVLEKHSGTIEVANSKPGAMVTVTFLASGYSEPPSD